MFDVATSEWRKREHRVTVSPPREGRVAAASFVAVALRARTRLHRAHSTPHTPLSFGRFRTAPLRGSAFGARARGWVARPVLLRPFL